MVPVVAEDYGGVEDKGTTYYAVAVARANNTGVNLGSLKGKKSCHTGYQKTAGYNTPVGYLINSEKMEVVGCGTNATAKAVSKFFSKSCIPGKPSCSVCRISLRFCFAVYRSMNQYKSKSCPLSLVLIGFL